MEKNKYFLIGIPNSGKTTLGRRVAEHLQIPFFDTDDIAKSRMGDIVTDGFSTVIWQAYDEQIKATLEFASHSGSAIIATGAEIGLIPKCVRLMRNIGFIIHVQRDVETILAELSEIVGPRYVVESRGGDTVSTIDLNAKIVQLYSKEIPHYDAVADLFLDNNSGEDKGAEQLILLIQALESMSAKKNSV